MKNIFVRSLIILLSVLGFILPQTFAAMTYVFQFGSGGSGNGQFSDLGDIAVDSSGNIFVADQGNSRIQKFNSSGTYVSQFGSFGSGNNQFTNLVSIAIDSSDNIYALNSNHVKKFNSSGTYVSQFGSFSQPRNIVIDSSGNIFVADAGNSNIQKFNSSGTYVSQFGSSGSGDGQFLSLSAIAIDSNDNIYAYDNLRNKIQKFNSSGTYVSQFGSSGSGDGQLSGTTDLAVDGSWNIYVVGNNTHRIQKFNSSGTYVSQFGSSGSGDGQLSWPVTIFIDSSGNIFVTDAGNSRIQKFSDVPSDITAPTLSQTTAVTTPTNDNTPAYTFTTNEAGTITYGGSCSSATTSATVGANTISFNTLADATYSNCTITVTDTANNASSALAVTAFTVDTTTPTISNITSSPLFPPGSAITWTTNEATTSRVEYGLTDSYGSFTTLDSSLVTSHTVNITGLEGTTYHYRVISADAAGNSIVGSDNTFVIANGGGGGWAVIHEEKKAERTQEKEIKEDKKEEKTEQNTEKEAEKTQENDVSSVQAPETNEAKINIQAPTTVVEEFEPFATRERTLSIALKLSGIEVTGLYICQNRFTDTPTPHSCEVAEKAQFGGLISQERTTFRPERYVTRIEAYSIFMQSVCVAPETNENNWKQLIIKKAIELGFTERTLETFRPDRAISTSEMFALAQKIGEWKKNNPNSCQNK